MLFLMLLFGLCFPVAGWGEIRIIVKDDFTSIATMMKDHFHSEAITIPVNEDEEYYFSIVKSSRSTHPDKELGNEISMTNGKAIWFSNLVLVTGEKKEWNIQVVFYTHKVLNKAVKENKWKLYTAKPRRPFEVFLPDDIQAIYFVIVENVTKVGIALPLRFKAKPVMKKDSFWYITDFCFRNFSWPRNQHGRLVFWNPD